MRTGPGELSGAGAHLRRRILIGTCAFLTHFIIQECRSAITSKASHAILAAVDLVLVDDGSEVDFGAATVAVQHFV